MCFVSGFEGVSSDLHLAYRIEEFPGAGFLLSMLAYKKYIEGKFNSCCTLKYAFTLFLVLCERNLF